MILQDPYVSTRSGFLSFFRIAFDRDFTVDLFLGLLFLLRLSFKFVHHLRILHDSLRFFVLLILFIPFLPT